MHELSIALSLMQLAEEQGRLHGAEVGKLAVMHIALGPLSGVEKEALISAFELAREASPFPLCRLEIREVALTGHCEACGETRDVVSRVDRVCAVCGGPVAKLITGREMQLESLAFSESSA